MLTVCEFPERRVEIYAMSLYSLSGLKLAFAGGECGNSRCSLEHASGRHANLFNNLDLPADVHRPRSYSSFIQA